MSGINCFMTKIKCVENSCVITNDYNFLSISTCSILTVGIRIKIINLILGEQLLMERLLRIAQLFYDECRWTKSQSNSKISNKTIIEGTISIVV